MFTCGRQVSCDVNTLIGVYPAASAVITLSSDGAVEEGNPVPVEVTSLVVEAVLQKPP